MVLEVDGTELIFIYSVLQQGYDEAEEHGGVGLDGPDLYWEPGYLPSLHLSRLHHWVLPLTDWQGQVCLNTQIIIYSDEDAGFANWKAFC